MVQWFRKKTNNGLGSFIEMKKRYFFNERNDLKSFEQSWKNDRFLINEQRFTKKRFFCWKKNFIGERILLDERLYWTNDFSEQNILLNNCSGKKHDIDGKKLQFSQQTNYYLCSFERTKLVIHEQ